MLRQLNNIKNKARAMTYAFLRWTERWTKTDMVYLAKGGGWMIMLEILSLLGIFLTTIFFANFTSQEVYGTYKYIISISGILNAFSLSGINTAVTKSVAKGYHGALRKSFWIQIKWNLFVTFLTLILAAYYYFNEKNFEITFSLIIVGATFPLLYSANTFTAYLSGIRDFKKIFQLNSTINTASSLSTIIGIIFFPNTVFLIFIYFITNTATNLISYLIVLKKYKPQNIIEPTTINYGKHLSLMNFFNIIANNIDKIITFTFLGPTQLAIYSLSISIPDQIRGVFKILPVITIPKIAANNQKTSNLIFIKKTIKSTIFSLPIILIYIIIAPLIYKIFFPQYLQSIFLSQVFVISLIFNIPTMLLIGYMQAKEMTKNLYQYNIFNAILQIISLIIFGYLGGLIGIILSRIITNIMGLITVILLIYKKNQ